MNTNTKNDRYTCADYRQEMILVGLKKKLQQPDLDIKERERLLEEIGKLEEKLGML